MRLQHHLFYPFPIYRHSAPVALTAITTELKPVFTAKPKPAPGITSETDTSDLDRIIQEDNTFLSATLFARPDRQVLDMDGIKPEPDPAYKGQDNHDFPQGHDPVFDTIWKSDILY